MTKQISYLGIDLGEERTKLVTFDITGKPQLVPNDEGELYTPTAVYVDAADGTVTIGKPAFRAAVLGDPKQLVTNFKRRLGEPDILVSGGGKDFTAADLAAEVVKQCVTYLPEPPTHISGSIPPKATQAARDSLYAILEATGAKVLHVKPEPLCAVAHFDHDSTSLVVDGGGSTWDSVLSTRTGTELSVKSYGTTHKAGHDLTMAIMDHAVKKFSAQFGPLREEDQPLVWRSLYNQAEQAKHALSRADTATIALPHEGKVFSLKITEEEFADLTKEIIEEIVNDVKDVVERGGGHFDDLIFVGGSAHVRAVREAIVTALHKKPLPLADPLFAVPLGGGLIARMLASGQTLGNRILPPLDQLNEVRDKSPKSLGVIYVNKADEKRLKVHIGEGTDLPTSHTERYGMVHAKQTSLELKVAQGEREALEDESEVLVNHSITGLPATEDPDDHPFQITLHIDKDARVTVDFKDGISDREESMDFVYDEALADLRKRHKSEEVA